VFAMGVLAPPLLEGDHFVGPVLRHDFGYDGCARYQRSPDFSIRGKHLRKGNGRAGIAGKPIHFNNIARSDSILFAAGADHRVHGTSLQPNLNAAETLVSARVAHYNCRTFAVNPCARAACLISTIRLRPAPMAAILDRLYHLHWVTPELARSAQPYLGFYARFLRPHGFKSLINLRGENADSRWWRAEKRTAERLGIRHFDVKLSSRNLPSRANLIALVDAFAAAEAPLLIKCSGGQDRTSLAAALYLLLRGGPGALAAAQSQFALWPYLHRPKRFQRWLRQLPEYFGETARGMTVPEWVRTRYRAEDFAAWLKARGMAQSYGALQAAE